MLAHARPGHLDVRVSGRVGRELRQRRCGKPWRDFRRRARTERCAVSAGPYLLFLFSLPPTLSLPPSLSRGRVCVQRVFCVRVCFAPGSTGSHDASVEAARTRSAARLCGAAVNWNTLLCWMRPCVTGVLAASASLGSVVWRSRQLNLPV